MEQTLSLYLEVRSGFHPDVATVGRACIALDAALKDAAFNIDPFNEFRFEIESGSEGSLNLNSIIRPVKAVLSDRKSLIIIASTISCWIAADVRSYISEKVIEEIVNEGTQQTLSEAEIRAIANQVAAQMQSNTAEAGVRQIFEAVQNDEMIEGVGIALRPKARPRLIVPRSEFEVRATAPDPPVPTEETRTVVSRERVTLVSPVLVPGNRRWRFRWGAGEFGAPIRDEAFLRRVIEGEEPIPMRGGIVMEVEVESHEVREGTLWRPTDRAILKVFSIKAAPEQGSFFESSAGK